MNTGNEEFTQEFFNESSKVWNSNKVRVGHSYKYKCEGICLSGRQCLKTSIQDSPLSSLHTCKQHREQAKEADLKSVTQVKINGSKSVKSHLYGNAR